MKSSFFIHSTSSLVMVILLLLSITDPIALSSPSDHSLGAALKNESFELDALGKTIKPIDSNSTEESPYFVAEIKTIIGFVQGIKSMYEFFDSLLNPAKTPEHTLKDVLDKMNAQFTEVMGDLKEIKAKLNNLEIAVYHKVELAINNAFNDMRHKNTIDIKSRALNLFDQLDAFMIGMLGKFNTLPDLLETVRDLYQCGTRNMEKKMNEFIAMVNVGIGGLAFYDRAINDKAIFDGENYSKTLSTKYELIRERVKGAMKNCASLDKAVIGKYISKILSINQEAHVQTGDVSRLLYKRFEDIYQSVRPDIVWVFYTAWDYKAFEADNLGGPNPSKQSAKSYNINYKGDGSSGVTINGGWTVIWVGHPLPAPAKWLDVRGSDLRPIIEAEQNNDNDAVYDTLYPGSIRVSNRNALALKVKMSPSLFSGRVPVFSLIVTNPPRAATIGSPLIGERMNVYQTRIDDIKWRFRGILTFPFWEAVVVDFIIF